MQERVSQRPKQARDESRRVQEKVGPGEGGYRRRRVQEKEGPGEGGGGDAEYISSRKKMRGQLDS